MEENQQSPFEEFANPVTEKKRHGCVTAWLIMMIATNSAVALAYFFYGNEIAASLPGVDIAGSSLAVVGVLGLLNVACAVLLFKWKKIGFFGFVASSILAFGFNMFVGLGIGQAISGLIGVGLLFAILQIKGANGVSAWEELE